jgi:hypothetical protein
VLIGNAATGYGFCGQEETAQMTYCACVNNSTACPQYSMASCANSAYAYKPWSWYQPGLAGKPSEDAKCEKTPICVNLVEVGGENNVVSGVTQQCGTFSRMVNILKASPALAVLAFLLLIALVVTLVTPSRRTRLPPPPPPDIFGDGGA